MTTDLNQFAGSTQKIHFKDGFGIQYCYPFAWKANLWVRSKIVEIVPVSWEENRTFKPDGTIEMSVAFKDADLAVAQAYNAGQPFYTALGLEQS